MGRVKNQQARESWIGKTLEALSKGSSLLDVGAGECAYKKHCGHLEYLAQDIAQYDDVIGYEFLDPMACYIAIFMPAFRR